MATAYEITRRELLSRQARIEARREPPSSNERLAEVRADYDDIYARVGAGGAPSPLYDESANAYRRRLLQGIRGLSSNWRDTDAYGIPSDALAPVEREIKREVEQTLADKRVGDLARNGQGLRRVDTVDDSGRKVTEWHGPVWFGASMMPPVQYVRRMNTGHPPVVRWAGSRAGR